MKIYKNILIGFISVLCFGLLIPQITSCNNGTEGLEFKLVDGESYTVVKYTGVDTDVIIPSKYKSKPVVSIGSFAFSGCSSLTSVTIGNGVTNIGVSAFYGCSSLETIVIPDSVTSIFPQAFSMCSSLTSITIPDSVTSIGNAAFSECSSLETIVIPDSVTSIGYIAFEGCNSLEYNKYDNGLYLGNEKNPYLAFMQPTNKEITTCEISENTKIISDYAFYWCGSLTNITMPDSVTSIGYNAFSGCMSLKSIVIPDSVTSIEDAFDKCSSLEYNKYDNGLYLGNEKNPYLAFIKTTNEEITTCEISENTKIIAGGAFELCSSLETIVIPDSVTSISYSAFAKAGYSALKNVTIPAIAISFIPKSHLQVVIITSGDTIPDHAFFDCDSLTSITIPKSVTSIGHGAFFLCDSLSTIYYTGTEEEWNKIDNDSLTDATIIYNYKS